MASPLPMGPGFVPHMPFSAGDNECEKYFDLFDFGAWERDQGNGVTGSLDAETQSQVQLLFEVLFILAVFLL
ncbi:unnamed protein product [Parascedosporium putredinis]|uniref:Uncharacterized protein n=1 Tax=Parascedosporium putredinis TaxID=1442378 RepID=A0A9P1H6N8_9PEZI|nr:unnamed protein product [Parascedosporium putredinis]CAI7998990.1 unnamed protein product [Parascedosporium putredinis]